MPAPLSMQPIHEHFDKNLASLSVSLLCIPGESPQKTRSSSGAVMGEACLGPHSTPEHVRGCGVSAPRLGHSGVWCFAGDGDLG